MGNRRTTRGGFTLAEMLVALALMAMLMLAAALGIQAAQTSYEYNREKAELVARARGVLDRIAHDIRLSQTLTYPNANTIEISTPEGDTETYSWDGQVGGNVTYVKTVDGVPSPAVALTGYVQMFTPTDQAPACLLKITLAGEHAQATQTITVTPKKLVF